MDKHIPCPVSAWSCPYHACMSDDCQKRYVISSGVDWGKGDCKTEGPIMIKVIRVKILLPQEITKEVNEETNMSPDDYKKSLQVKFNELGVDADITMDYQDLVKEEVK